MKTQNSSHGVCTHCACHNPMWKILEEDIFHSSIFSKITAGLKALEDPAGETIVISGGIIRPMINGNTDTVEAIGIHGGKVIAAGSRESVISAMNRNGFPFKEKHLDEKQTLLPGLIEPHVHIVPTALMGGWLDLSRFQGQDLRTVYDVQWLKETIREHIHKHRLEYFAGAWILGKGVDPALMPFKVNDDGGLNELITIDCDLLDTITADIPLLMMSASMHTCYVNTKALKYIYDNNAVVRQQYDNSFEKYKKQTKGQLQEEAGMSPAFATIPKLQVAEMALGCFKHLTEIFKTANERGVTFMYDARMTEQLKTFLDLYIPLHEKRVRIGAAQVCTTLQDAENLPEYKPVNEYADVYYGNIKLVSDGSNQGLTGYQSDAYCCNPADNYGLFNFIDGDKRPLTPPQIYSQIVHTILADKGWPLMIHANGDLAVQFAIDVYEAAISAINDTSLRNRIEHCSLLTAEQISDMQRLGISPSFLIGHVGYWGYAFREAIFEGKAEQLDLCRSALNAGLKITLHSDNEVSPLGPLRMMEQAITRIMEAAPSDMKDNILNPAERISPEQALRAATTDAAWQCYADQWVGSLAEGFYADFVILEQDPLTLPEYYMVLRNIPVLETWRGGVQVYAGISTDQPAAMPEASAVQ
ncbi:amidohydrolase [Chitinophagaceae bacterium MMS25-I14]